MPIDFDYFSSVLASVARDLSADQIIFEGLLSNAKSKQKLSTIILRNKINTDVLSQLTYIAQNLSASQMQSVSLIKAIEQSTNTFDSKTLNFKLDRNKPLLDVLADQNILVATLKVIFCLLKLENPKNKNIDISFRRRGGYVSMRIVGANAESNIAYLDDVIGLLNTIFLIYGAKSDWRLQSHKRVVFIRLYLAKQITLGYNN